MLSVFTSVVLEWSPSSHPGKTLKDTRTIYRILHVSCTDALVNGLKFIYAHSHTNFPSVSPSGMYAISLSGHQNMSPLSVLTGICPDKRSVHKSTLHPTIPPRCPHQGNCCGKRADHQQICYELKSMTGMYHALPGLHRDAFPSIPNVTPTVLWDALTTLKGVAFLPPHLFHPATSSSKP